MTLIMPTLWNQKVVKPITTAKAIDENLESDRTSNVRKNTNKTILAIFRSFKQPAMKPTQQVS